MVIALHPYKPGWPAEFQAIRADIARLLPSRALHIAHIGSTAVPGMAAKDIIDVQVTVAALQPDLADALTAGGYVHVAQHSADHTPAGAADAPASWAKLYFEGPATRRPCHVHVRVAGQVNQRYALLFRDYLRAHPSSRAKLEVVKRELARLHPNDEDAYYAVKDPVYDLVWDAASDWARRSGWQAPAATEA